MAFWLVCSRRRLHKREKVGGPGGGEKEGGERWSDAAAEGDACFGKFGGCGALFLSSCHVSLIRSLTERVLFRQRFFRGQEEMAHPSHREFGYR